MLHQWRSTTATRRCIPNSTLSNLGYGGAVGAFVLGPFNYTSLTSVIDRDNVVNLHFGIPHKNGTKDDIQLLGMVNYIDNVSVRLDQRPRRR